MSKEVLVIGDVHGCLDQLKHLVESNKDRRIIIVGDLIDRGANSEGVIDYVRSNNIECVRGNHEDMATEVLHNVLLNDKVPDDSKAVKTIIFDWGLNGGLDVMYEYSSLEKLKDDIEWLSKLPLFIETGVKNDDGQHLVVTHTYRGDRYLHVKDELDYLWSRKQPRLDESKSEIFNIFGHTPTTNLKGFVGKDVPRFTRNSANVDTGCCYTGTLTGVVFPTLEVKHARQDS